MDQWFWWNGGCLRLRVRVQPRASRDEIVGPIEGRLKVRVTAAPSEGRANRRLVELLAREFGVAKSNVTLEAGAGRRDKRLAVVAPKALPHWLRS